MDKKSCCPYCGASPEYIRMELPTVVEFSMIADERGKVFLDSLEDDVNMIIECSTDDEHGNHCECQFCDQSFYGAADDGDGYVFSKEKF